MSSLHQIALSLAPQVGAVTARQLVSYCGSAEAVFRASRKELLKIPGIGPVVADALQQSEILRRAEAELSFLEKHNIHLLFFTDSKYPARLKMCPDSPTLLFFKGSDVDLLSSERIIGMVGTRQPSEQGKAVCEDLVEELAAYNVTLVSGLAFGVDVTAHRKAVQINMPNIGCLGHGLGSIYPAAHRGIAAEMVNNGGLLTEYISPVKADREHFPMRNRIIAGLCDALIVIETATSGGSMITANLAIQYERELMAVPGRVHDLKSAGCNLLIKNNSAKLIENAADVAALMRWAESGKEQPIQTQLLFDLPPAEARLLDLVRQHPEIPVDLLAAQASMNTGELASLLLSLEFRGALRTLPGKRYIATG